MNILETKFGYEMRTPEIHILFGGVEAQFTALQNHYSNYNFKRLKQIHSDDVYETTALTADYQVLGDAHYTFEKGLALCIITADCVPALFFDPSTQLIAGAHAGWRGVASKIIPKTLQSLAKHGAQPRDIQTYIGPHIQKPSFEVGLDVRDQILGSLGPLAPEERSLYSENISNGKALVDLSQIVKTQLENEGVTADHVSTLFIDTVKDRRFHSHRRDKEKAGRQVSFICRP